MSSTDHRGVPQGNAAIIAAIIGGIALIVTTGLGIFIGRSSDGGQTTREVTRIITATMNAESTVQAQATDMPQATRTSPLVPTTAPIILIATPTLDSYVKEYVIIKPFGTRHISLKRGELIVGTADKFQEDVSRFEPPFTAFLIEGPIEMDLTLWNGGWDHWVNVFSNETKQYFLDQKVDEVKRHSSYPQRGHTCVVLPMGSNLLCH